MAQYLFVYHGGGMPESEEEGKRAMEAWGNWFAAIGSNVVDGGKPVGPSTTVSRNGTVVDVVDNGGSNPTTGYGIFEAENLDQAVALAEGCPILASGGSVEIAETFDP